jgi:hypothetical protein
MSGPISSFAVGLPAEWHAVPSGDVPPAWADATAATLVAGVDGP